MMSFFSFLSPAHLNPEGLVTYHRYVIASTLIISVLSLALPIMTLQVYDRILPNQGSGTLPILVIGVCVAVILELCMRLGRAWLMSRCGAAYEHRMACAAMQKIIHADLSRLKKTGIGDSLNQMSSLGRLRDFHNGYVHSVAIELLLVPLSLGLCAYISGALVLVPAIILGVFILVSIRAGRHLKEALHHRETADDKRFNFLVEALEGVHTVKSFALEKYMERRYEALEEESTLSNYHVTQQTSATFSYGAIFSHIMVASVITIGAMFVLQGYLTTGALIATLLLSGRLMQPIQKALALWVRYQDISLAAHHANTLLSMPQQEVTKRHHTHAPIPQGRLICHNISFAFEGNPPLFQDISLHIKKGETIALRGDHGSGKTTLLKIIAGIYPVTSGEILLDDERVESYFPYELVRHVGFVRAQPLIFRGTIRDNLTGFGHINEVGAREVATLLGVDKDIATLPAGLDTFLSGNDTDNIPMGMKQKISIVRALAAKPKLILFDNADYALDAVSYGKLYQLLARLRGNVSMILVSDDMNISALADMHYMLEEGKIIKTDRHHSMGIVHPYRELQL